MHDPTEGGFLWGVKELELSTGIGLEIDLDSVPTYDETTSICKHFKINPLGLIASGSLLVAASQTGAAKIIEALSRTGIECADIGGLRGNRSLFLRKGKPVRFTKINADEISKVV